jgi:hypothetical protein
MYISRAPWSHRCEQAIDALDSAEALTRHGE